MTEPKIFRSINPAEDGVIDEVKGWNERQIERALVHSSEVAKQWAALPLEKRTEHLRAVAATLINQREELAKLITCEMGKLMQKHKGSSRRCGCS